MENLGTNDSLFELDFGSTLPRLPQNLIFQTDENPLPLTQGDLDLFGVDSELEFFRSEPTQLESGIEVPTVLGDDFGCDLHPEVAELLKTMDAKDVPVDRAGVMALVNDLDLDCCTLPKEEPIEETKPNLALLSANPSSSVPRSRDRKAKAGKKTVSTTAISRRPVVGDALDKVIYGLFPLDILRLERPSFNQWKKEHGIRKLSPPESKRLSKIRRTILARVYAERARQRRDQSHRETATENDSLRDENDRLKMRIAELEHQVASLASASSVPGGY